MKTVFVEDLIENGPVMLQSLPLDYIQSVNPLALKQKQQAQQHYLERSKLPACHTRTVEDLLRERVEAVVHSTDFDEEKEDAFFIADIGEVIRQFYRWRRLLPRIEPFYAIKCNPDPCVLDTLAGLGAGFDCASREEIAMVLQTGVDPSRIIYANPCKQSSMIRYAAHQNVRMMTFDNEEELHKIKKFFPNAQLVLRILVDDSYSVCRFGTKFGASLEVVPQLLTTAKQLELDVIGISFHVGSGCMNAIAFEDAVSRARKAFDMALDIGYNFTLLDVGGGYPGSKTTNGITFEEIAEALGKAVDKHFPDDSVRIIAEPGRYFVSTAFTLAAHVTARRTVPRDRAEAAQGASGNDHPSYMFYINDGVYGSFNCILYDHAVVQPRVLVKDGQFYYGQSVNEQSYLCSIWGPTCDSMDCITKDGNLPMLDVGDWLYFEEMGAYTCAAASTFNGFKRSNIVYTNTLKSEGCGIQ